MRQVVAQIINTISHAENILIMPSTPVDGDSLGSALALYLSIKKLNKSVTVVCAEPVPEVYEFLPMSSSISRDFTPAPDFIVTIDTSNSEIASLQSLVEENKFNIILTPKNGQLTSQNVTFSHGPHRYDLIITVDTADLQQLSRFYTDNRSIFSEIPVINIDHHASNEHFGRINFVDIMSSSTAELVLEVLESLEHHSGVELIDADIATALLAGLITDTGSFQHSNTNPKSFSNSARLIKRGARQQEIIQHVYKTKQLTTLRLWGRILSAITVDNKHRLLWSKITQKDLRETGSSPEESGAIIDELMSNAPNMDIVILLKEKSPDLLSGSIRTLSDAVDASELAAMFGGGGHARAAGFKIAGGNIEKNSREIIEKISEFQRKRLNLHDHENSLPSVSTNSNSKQVNSKPDQLKSPENTAIHKTEKGQKLNPGTLYKFES